MKRQLYYLFPDVKHTQEACEDLKQLNVPNKSLHVVMTEKKIIDGINDIHSIKETDFDDMLERFLWRLNLAIFALALLSLPIMLVWLPAFYVIIPIVFMLTTFMAGLYFAIQMPNTHWNEFISAIKHGDILLIIDVPTRAIREVDRAIHQQHPEAITGGVCWKL